MKWKKVALFLILIFSHIWFVSVFTLDVSSSTFNVTESPILENISKDNLDLIGQWDQNYGIAEDIFIQDDFVFLAGEGLIILDISNPAKPVFVSQFKDNEESRTKGVYIRDNLAFIVGYSKGLRILDISDITNPILLGSYGTHATCVFVQDDYAYIIGSPDAFEVIDISDPENPVKVGAIQQFNCSPSYRLLVNGSIAYVSSGCGLDIINISNPEAPIILHKYHSIEAYDLVLHNQIAFVAARYNGFVILDVSDPSNPQNISQLFLNYSTYDIYYSNKVVYLSDNNYGLTIINVSDITNPKIIPHTLKFDSTYNIVQNKDVLYLLTTLSEVYSVNIMNPNNPQQLGVFDLGGNSEDVAIKGNFAFIANGLDGLVVLDIKNKTHPVLVSRVNSGNYSVKVYLYNVFAFVVTQYRHACSIWEKIVIFDISNKNNPQFVSEFRKGFLIYDMQFIDTSLYIVSENNLEIYDISNPLVPVLMNNYDNFGSLLSLKITDDIILLGTTEGLIILELLTSYNVSTLNFCFNNTYIFKIAIENNKGVMLTGIYDVGFQIVSVDFSDLTNPVNKSSMAIESLFSDGLRYVYNYNLIMDDSKVYTLTSERLVIISVKNNGQLEEIGQFTSQVLTGIVLVDTGIYLSAKYDGLLVLDKNFTIGFDLSIFYYMPISTILIVIIVFIRKRKKRQ